MLDNAFDNAKSNRSLSHKVSVESELGTMIVSRTVDHQGPPEDKSDRRAQIFKRYDFDPDGESIWWVAFSNPWQMYQTAKISSEAEFQAVVSQPPGPDGRTWDNATDAWRHAYGSFLMSKKYGVE